MAFDSIEDMIADWKSNIPPHLRKKDGPGWNSASAVAKKAKAERDEDAPEVIAMYRKGLSCAVIGATVGLAANTVKKILQENGEWLGRRKQG